MTPTQMRTVASLNAVSFLAQLAQFGVVYPLLALWLQTRGVAAPHIGWVVASVWPGMLMGNLLAPALLARHSAKALALCSGLGTAGLALLLPRLPAAQTASWMVAAAGFGFFVGVRWVGVESWLFALIDGPMRARLIAVHETLIYAAQFLGPVCIAALGVQTPHVFDLAALIAVGTALPLCLASRPDGPRQASVEVQTRPLAVLHGLWLERVSDPSLALGMLAGLMDGALLGMLSVHLLAVGHDANHAAWLLGAFGLGGLLSQLPLGWLCDRRGLAAATRLTAWAGAVGALLLSLGSGVAVWAAMLLLGALAANGLTLATTAAVAHANRHQANQRQANQRQAAVVIAISRVAIAFTIGSALGPVLAGYAMQISAHHAMPALTFLSCLALWAWASRSGAPLASATFKP
jgi:MFS family permease